MPWLRLRLRVDRTLVDALSQALEDSGAVAVTLEDAGNEPLFGSGADEEPSLWHETSVTALLPSDTEPQRLIDDVAQRLGMTAPPSWDTQPLADQDWERAWMDRFHAMHFGNNLWVCPSWLAPPPPPATVVTLDPGLAFGTGTHATTALCLEWLANHELTDKEIIDFGCGSGILAVAALKRGARRAWGIDIDSSALAVARENAERNGVSDRLEVAQPQVLPEGLIADLVIANILAKPLIELAPRLTRMTRPGGQLILSGLLTDQIAEVALHYANEFAIEARMRDDWALLECHKRTLVT